MRQIEEILPKAPRSEVDRQAAEDASETNEFITFLQDFLLAFGGIALFVGSFVIANSLSITIAQRTRELATLRTLGASRRQVLVSIIIESLVVGIVASFIGLFLGLLLAEGLFWLFDAVGFTLPNTGLVFEARTIVVALLAGILVTLFASLRPAIRATRVPPIAAVREGATLPPGRFGAFAERALLMTTAGFAALLYGLFGSGLDTTQILIWMGLGVLLVFLGVALFSSRLVRPLAQAARLACRSDRRRRGPPRADNARRNPQRTASTAAALMIGLALVTLVATLAAGIARRSRGSQRPLHRRLRDHRAKQLLAHPRGGGRGRGEPGRHLVGNVRTGETLVLGTRDFIDRRGRQAGRGHRHSLDRGLAGRVHALGPDGAFVDDELREGQRPCVGSRSR